MLHQRLQPRPHWQQPENEARQWEREGIHLNSLNISNWLSRFTYSRFESFEVGCECCVFHFIISFDFSKYFLMICHLMWKTWMRQTMREYLISLQIVTILFVIICRKNYLPFPLLELDFNVKGQSWGKWH